MRWACAVVMAIMGCSDDDAESIMDAGPDGSAGRASAGRGGGGTGSPRAGRDAGGGQGGGDAGDPCSAYPLEDMPLWTDPDDGILFSARRVPLDVLCVGECDRARSLADFEAGLRCGSTEDDAGAVTDFDAGSRWELLQRSEGCGTVQFTAGPHPRVYNFDADTAELIGYARLDDAPAPLVDGCESAGWIAGTVRTSCAGETVTSCEPR